MPDKTYAKFILNNETYLDLTGDTVDSSSLLAGYTAHNRSGELITGSFDSSIFVLKAGDTMSGALTLSGAPTENLHAATKKYVDDSVANYLPLTGGIMGKTVEDPNDDTHTHVYTNSVFPDYIAMVDTEYQSSSIINQTLNAITSSGIGFSKLYTGTGVPFTSEATLNDQALTFTATPDGGAQSTYASYKKDGISYTTYNYVFPSKSGTFALTNDLLSYIPKTGGTITGGYLIIDDTHLTSGSSSAYLTLGNNVDSSSEGSSFGVLHLYGTGVYKSSIRTTTLTDNRQLYLPDKDGTLAVTDDLDSYVLKTGDSLSGALSFYDGSTLKSKISNTELQIDGINMLNACSQLANHFATAISSNANLNTTTFLQVGRYRAATNAIAQSLSNCPTIYGFYMETGETISLDRDPSTQNNYYFVQTIVDLIGDTYRRGVYKEGSAATVYSAWKKLSAGEKIADISTEYTFTANTWANPCHHVVSADGWYAVQVYVSYSAAMPQSVAIIRMTSNNLYPIIYARTDNGDAVGYSVNATLSASAIMRCARNDDIILRAKSGAGKNECVMRVQPLGFT